MKYFKMFLMWMGFIGFTSWFGEYIISREVNVIIQLLCFVVVVFVLGYVINETIELTKTKKEKND